MGGAVAAAGAGQGVLGGHLPGDIQQFIAWVQQGDATLQQRYDMFVERRKSVEEQISQLQKTLEFIEYKCWYYSTALEAGTEAVHQKAEKRA